MVRRPHFVIIKSDSQYNIREYDGADVKEAYVNDGILSGDGSVMLRLSRVIPDNVSVNNYLERKVNHVIFPE